jgi:hypothetical protein
VKERRILFETSLAETSGRLLWRNLAVLMVFVGCVLFMDFATGSFPKGALWFALVGLIIIGKFRQQLRRFLLLRRNSGVYQISIDSYGLYVHSDAPDFAPSFSVPATDISRLVRLTIKDSDGDEYEYYVETKSQRRYRIQDILLSPSKLEVMDLFDRITDVFTTVEIVEEEVGIYESRKK